MSLNAPGVCVSVNFKHCSVKGWEGRGRNLIIIIHDCFNSFGNDTERTSNNLEGTSYFSGPMCDILNSPILIYHPKKMYVTPTPLAIILLITKHSKYHKGFT